MATKKVKKQINTDYTLTLKVAGTEYSVSGNDLENVSGQLRQKLIDENVKIRGKSIFALKHRGLQSEIQKNMWSARLFLYNKLTPYIVASRLKMLLK